MCALNTELAYWQYAWKGKGGENVENCSFKLFIFCCQITEQQHYSHTYNCNAIRKRENKGLG